MKPAPVFDPGAGHVNAGRTEPVETDQDVGEPVKGGAVLQPGQVRGRGADGFDRQSERLSVFEPRSGQFFHENRRFFPLFRFNAQPAFEARFAAAVFGRAFEATGVVQLCFRDDQSVETGFVDGQFDPLAVLHPPVRFEPDDFGRRTARNPARYPHLIPFQDLQVFGHGEKLWRQ